MLENNVNLRSMGIALVVMLPVMFLMTTIHYKLSIIVAPLLLVTMILLAKRQQLNVFFYILIFQIPFGAYRRIGEVNISWLLALVVLLAVVFDIMMRKRDINLLKCNIWYYLLPMLFINLIATALSPYKETAIEAMINWVAAYFFMGLMLMLVSERGVFKDVPAWIIASVSLSAAFAAMSIYLGIGIEWFTQYGEGERGVGGAPDPNNLSLMIIFAIPMVLHYLLNAKTWFMRISMLFLFCINFMGILSTNSRGGLVIAGLVSLVMFFIHAKKMKARFLGVVFPVFFIFLLALPFIVPQRTLMRLATITTDTQDRSMLRRSAYYDVAFRAYMEHPIIGHGPFTFQNVFSQSREALKFQRNMEDTLLRQAHNTYLEIIVGSGTLGMFLFLGVIIQAQINFFRAKKLLLKINNIEYADLITSFQISFFGLLIYLSVFSDPYHKYLLIMLPLSALALRYARNFELNFKN